MSQAEKKVQYVKRVNVKHLFLIAVILIAILSFGKLTNFFGKYTGEVADDDRVFNKQAEAWNGAAVTAVLDSGGEVWLPQKDTFAFDSEQTEQLLDLGCPADSPYPLHLTLRVQDNEIYRSGILEPGKGIGMVETHTVFQPNSYEAVVVYTFYHLDGHRLKTLGELEKPVTLVVTGSGDKYQAGTTKDE